MPILKSDYQPPVIFRNYHISTLYAALFRRVDAVNQVRRRLELPDGDFLDIDHSYSHSKNSKKLLIVLHGLEGNAQRPYILGMAGYFNRYGWDVAAINFRGCSGEDNRLYRSYNAGAIEDLQAVIDHFIKQDRYSQITLNGFSLGGNLMLKYLGEKNNQLPSQIKAAVAVSTPCDLYASLKKLEEPQNRLYSLRFVKKLKKQLYRRAEKFPDKIDKQEIAACKSLFSIDELYTSRAHGFENARDYYEKSSSLPVLHRINIPVLLINAKNDHFLSSSSSPEKIARENEFLHLETPEFGGHVGFLQNKKQTYTEERALQFLEFHVS